MNQPPVPNQGGFQSYGSGYPTPTPTLPPRRGGMPIWAIILIVVIAVVVIGCCLGLLLLGIVGSQFSTIFSSISSALTATP